jgi:acyl-CoA synthetase (NDP forming)
MPTHRLDRLVAPPSLAVVGEARAKLRSAGMRIENIVAGGFAGPIHVVNPNYGAIESIATVKSIDAIPLTPDVVVIIAAAWRPVEAAIRDGRRWLDPLEVAEVMVAYAIPTLPTVLARDAEEAAAAARPFLAAGRPVVVNILSQVGCRRRAARSCFRGGGTHPSCRDHGERARG